METYRLQNTPGNNFCDKITFTWNHKKYRNDIYQQQKMGIGINNN